MRVCQNCGEMIPDTAKFCRNCGAAVVAEPVASINQTPLGDERTEVLYEAEPAGDAGFEYQDPYQAPAQEVYQEPAQEPYREPARESHQEPAVQRQEQFQSQKQQHAPYSAGSTGYVPTKV